VSLEQEMKKVKVSTAPSPPQAARDATRLELAVVSGIHRGVSLMLDQAEYDIGSSAQADIMLRDAGVASYHARLCIAPGAVCIEATGADVVVDNGVLARGHGRRVRVPIDLMLGEARLRISYDEPGEAAADVLTSRLDAVGKLLARKPLGVAGVLVCLVIAMSLVFARGLSRADANDKMPTRIAAQRPGFGDRKSSIEQATRELADRLEQAGIRTLRVSAAEGRLAVTGKLSRQGTVAWTAIQQWFDAAYGEFVMTANVTVGDSRNTPSLQLQAVWYGDRPHIITAEGEHYYQGAVLDDGWILKEVGEDRLLLTKEGETALVVTYR
jgi:hypothetical protein